MFFKSISAGGRLRNKILTIMVLVGVIPLGAIGFLSIYSLNLTHALDVASVEDNVLKQNVEEIQGFMNNILSTFQIQVFSEGLAALDASQQKFLLEQLLEEHASLAEAAFLNVVDPKLPVGAETARHNRAHPAGVAPEELQNLSQSEKFSAVMAGRDFLGPAYFTLAGPMVSIALPVKNPNNDLIAVLTGEINLSGLQKLVQKSRLGNSGYLYLVNEDGFLIAHSEPNKFVAGNMRASGFVAELVRGTEHLGAAGQSRYRSIWGQEVVAAGTAVPKLKWGLVAEWPAEDADAIINTIRNQIFISSAVVLSVIFLVSVFLANRIVGPIKTLEAGTDLIAKGKFDQPVSIKTGDELEELGVAFNNMMAGLKRLEELKEEFVFVAAHELRTPVTAIKGYLGMVMAGDAGPVSAEVRELIVQVNTANARLVQLVEDLLAVARSEAGRLEIKVTNVEVDASVKEVLRELAPLAAEKQIKLVYDPGPIPAVLADSARLREVLVNLVGNAIKYTPGAGTVTVTCERQGSELVVSITDTGLGISAEAQKKLFEKFYRVQTKDTANISGTGLGLFIVKQIVEKMNGRIWVRSTEGQGSTFSFSLKLA